MSLGPAWPAGEAQSIRSPWPALECVRDLTAVAVTWQRLLGPQADWFQQAFLARGSEPVGSYPCQHDCGCAHEVVVHGPADVEAVCRCERGDCESFPVLPDDLFPWELSWTRLGRALSKAFGLSSAGVQFGLKNTLQIGSWSADAVPVILTIQTNSGDTRNVVTALVARLRQPFILLVPSTQHLDISSKELLGNVGAACFALDHYLPVSSDRVLQPRQTPGEMFSRFAPQPKDLVEEGAARKAFALVKALDADKQSRKASLFTVFRLYCIEGLTAEQVARRCRCARALVFSRLNALQAKLGAHPRTFRHLATHLDQIETSMSDSRARRIYRKGAIYGEEELDEE